MCGMLHPVYSQHMNRRHCQISSGSCTYSYDKFRRLSLEIDWINYRSLIIPQTYYPLTFILLLYTKCNKTNFNTYQPRHSCTTVHWYTTKYTPPSAYIAIRINYTFNSCCTPTCTRSEGGLRHCISSKGVGPSTTITSKIALSDTTKLLSSAQRQTSYKLVSRTIKQCLPHIRYIHHSHYHTHLTELSQLLIQKYDHLIAHIYQPVTVLKKTYYFLCTQYPFKW